MAHRCAMVAGMDKEQTRLLALVVALIGSSLVGEDRSRCFEFSQEMARLLGLHAFENPRPNLWSKLAAELWNSTQPVVGLSDEGRQVRCGVDIGKDGGLVVATKTPSPTEEVATYPVIVALDELRGIWQQAQELMGAKDLCPTKEYNRVYVRLANEAEWHLRLVRMAILNQLQQAEMR